MRGSASPSSSARKEIKTGAKRKGGGRCGKEGRKGRNRKTSRRDAAAAPRRPLQSRQAGWRLCKSKHCRLADLNQRAIDRARDTPRDRGSRSVLWCALSLAPPPSSVPQLARLSTLFPFLFFFSLRCARPQHGRAVPEGLTRKPRAQARARRKTKVKTAAKQGGPARGLRLWVGKLQVFSTHRHCRCGGT